MLTRVDCVQLAVPDRARAAEGWKTLLDAEPAGEDRIAALSARRSRYRLGRGHVEFLEPDGEGVLADALRQRGRHLFAAGLATADFDGLLGHLRGLGIAPVLDQGQACLDPAMTGVAGLRVVISPDEAMERVGAIDFFYETTLLTADAAGATARCAELFALDRGNFVPISSDTYGYTGFLTLFRPNRLDRFEIITPTALEKTMGRFFHRAGDSFYMAFAETDQLPEIEERARASNSGFTAVRPPERPAQLTSDQVFLHPPALGGMMLGLSRPSMAWDWSGQPERVEAVA